MKTTACCLLLKHKNKVDTLIVKTKDIEADSLQIETKPKSNIGFEEKFYIRPNLPLVDFDEETN